MTSLQTRSASRPLEGCHQRQPPRSDWWLTITHLLIFSFTLLGEVRRRESSRRAEFSWIGWWFATRSMPNDRWNARRCWRHCKPYCMRMNSESKPALEGKWSESQRLWERAATYSCVTTEIGRPEKFADFLSRRSKAALTELITTIGCPRRVK